jgi:hypothetical protein
MDEGNFILCQAKRRRYLGKYLDGSDHSTLHHDFIFLASGGSHDLRPLISRGFVDLVGERLEA